MAARTNAPSGSKRPIKSFRYILNYIGRNLSKEDRASLVFLKNLPAKDAERCTESLLEFWKYMESRNDTYCYHAEDPSELFDDLREIGQESLAAEAERMYDQFLAQKRCEANSTNPSPVSTRSPESNARINQEQFQQHGHINSPETQQSTPATTRMSTIQAYSPPPAALNAVGNQQAAAGQDHSSRPLNAPRAAFPSNRMSSRGMEVGMSAASPGLKSSEGLPTMPSSLVPGQGAGSISTSEPQQYVNPGSNISVPGQLMINEPSHAASPGLKSSEGLPTMPSSALPGRGAGSISTSEPLQYVNPGSNISVPGQLTFNEPSHAASPGLKSSEGLPTMPSSALPGRGAGSISNSEPLQYANPGSNISIPGQLTFNEPSHFTNPVRAVPGQKNTVHPVQPASAHAPGNSSPATSSPGLRSTERLPQMSSNIPQDESSPNAMSYRNLEASGGGRTESQRVGPTQRQSQLGGGEENKHTLEYPVQPSSTVPQLGNIQDQLGKMTLSGVEGLLKGVDPPLKLYKETVIDAGTKLDKDVVKDSATPKRPTTSQEQSITRTEGEVDFPVLDFSPPKESKTQTELRKYQVELAEMGIQGFNYIVCAPTGSGKTITAAHVCFERMLATESDGRAFKALFIVPTRHLKKQQRDAFNDLFAPGQVTSLGEGQQFNDVFSKGNIRVLMITAQILVNAIALQQFALASASMIIFDECHHTTLKHPYNEIMRQYLKEKKVFTEQNSVRQWPVGRPCNELPQVVGLTASIGTGASRDAHAHIVVLCANLDSYGVKTVSQPENVAELKECNKPPEEDEIIATPSKRKTTTSSRFIEIFETTMSEIEENVLKKHIPDFNPPLPGTQDYESWIAKIRSDAEVRYPDLYYCANYLFRLNLALMIYDDLRAVDALISMETFKSQAARGEPLGGRHCRLLYEKNLPELKRLAKEDNPMNNPKLLCLVQLIKDVYKSKSGSQGIVLARTRFATSALLDFIRTHTDLTGPGSPKIKCERIVGQNKEVEDGMTESKQEAALKKFRDGRANLLVATDIVQEGLNIPACNVIIRYNFVSNEIGTVQSKGRARAEGSKCYLIVERGSVNEAREINNRARVKEMAIAITAANQMDRSAWLEEIRKRQLSIIDNVEQKEAEKKARFLDNQASDCKMLCAKCDAYICMASSLERRLSNYTCLDPTVGERTRNHLRGVQEFRESRTLGFVSCAKCGNQLGQALEFKRHRVWKPGYNFTVKSFKFSFNDGEPRSFSKWKKVDFQIAVEEQ